MGTYNQSVTGRITWIFGSAGAVAGLMWWFERFIPVFGVLVSPAAPGVWFLLLCWTATMVARAKLPHLGFGPLRLVGGLLLLTVILQLTWYAPAFFVILIGSRIHGLPFSEIEVLWIVAAIEGTWLVLAGSTLTGAVLRVFGQPFCVTFRWLLPRLTCVLVGSVGLLVLVGVVGPNSDWGWFAIAVIASIAAAEALFAIAFGRALWRAGGGSLGSSEGAL